MYSIQRYFKVILEHLTATYFSTRESISLETRDSCYDLYLIKFSCLQPAVLHSIILVWLRFLIRNMSPIELTFSGFSSNGGSHFEFFILLTVRGSQEVGSNGSTFKSILQQVGFLLHYLNHLPSLAEST
jgi:hypothetical protein